MASHQAVDVDYFRLFGLMNYQNIYGQKKLQQLESSFIGTKKHHDILE